MIPRSPWANILVSVNSEGSSLVRLQTPLSRVHDERPVEALLDVLFEGTPPVPGLPPSPSGSAPASARCMPTPGTHHTRRHLDLDLPGRGFVLPER